MLTIQSLIDSNSFQAAFKKCCSEYNRLDIYVAWIGNPQSMIPFEYLHHVPTLNAVVGVSFCQTHPAGLEFLISNHCDLRIANEEVLFHPKVYIFSAKDKKAVFVGSSNLTYHGFYENGEANMLIEGEAEQTIFSDIENDLSHWRKKNNSFKPDDDWLKKYTDRYWQRRKKMKAAGLEDETGNEDTTANLSAWLVKADWPVYMKQFRKAMKQHELTHGENLPQKIALLDRISTELSIPWKREYFENIENRRLIGGMYPYGWLGNVSASGDFRRMLKNGTTHEYNTIIASVNAIAELTIPLDTNKLRFHLDKLVALGPTMKVWGRVLSITRPDLYCTISAPWVRKAMGNILNIPEKEFQHAQGYVRLQALIHSSPWFRSEPPANKYELDIWKRRAAFLDVIFY